MTPERTAAKNPRLVVLQALTAVSGVLAGLMVLRLLFLALMANPANPMTAIVDRASRPFLVPWALFWPPPTGPGVIVERATLAALCTYVVIGAALGLIRRTLAAPGVQASSEGQEEKS
jgi:hypothetical protein